MSEAFVGEVRLVGFNFAPQGWAICNGKIFQISDNPALFNLIGNTYGGDGQTTFAIPGLQGRVPVHMGPGYTIGTQGGVETVAITAATFPVHQHSLVMSSSPGNSNNPNNAVVGSGPRMYRNEAPTTAMSATMVSTSAGAGLAHNNLQPYQTLNWIIALYGIFPSQ
jgi:microcystin-dependent protein